jgi:hypothetical protein
VRKWIAWLLTGRSLEGPVQATVRGRQRQHAPRVQTVLAVSLTVAGAVAIVAVLNGQLSTTDLRVLGTSIGFAVFSATWAAGSAAARHHVAAARWVGAATSAFSALALVLLVVALWSYDKDALRAFGSVALLALAGSHASIVLRGQRESDAAAIWFLCTISIVLASLDCVAGALLIQGAFEIHDAGSAVQLETVVVIAMVVTTALPPLIRRRPAPHTATPVPPAPPPPPEGPPAKHAARLRPTAVYVLAAFTAIGGFALGAATGEPSRPVYAAPAPPPPPQTVYVTQPTPPNPWRPLDLPRVLVTGHPAPVPGLLEPTVMFRCPRLERREVRSDANFERIELSRGPNSLCLRVAGDLVESLYTQGPAKSEIVLTFYRHGGFDPPDYEVVIQPYTQAPDAYRVMEQWRGQARGQFLSSGRFGMSAWQAALLVAKPAPPRWILDRSTRWRVSLG